jgi:hypothetical protein
MWEIAQGMTEAQQHPELFQAQIGAGQNRTLFAAVAGFDDIFNLFGCDSPKLASSRFRVIFLLILRSLLRGVFISCATFIS